MLARLPAELSLAAALRTMISAVTSNEPPRANGETASEQVALSYYWQSKHKLPNALKAARAAVEKSPDFAFGLERIAELEFGNGHVPEASKALERSLAIAPRNAQAHALKGFLFSAQNRIKDAIAEFE